MTGWRVRSQESINERRKRTSKNRELYYQPRKSTAPFSSAGPQSWLRVPTSFKKDAKSFVSGKMTKALRETQVGQKSNSLRGASASALHEVAISSSTHSSDQLVNSAANKSKHRTTRAQMAWAAATLAADPHCTTATFGDTAGNRAWADTFDDDVDASYEMLFPTLNNSETIDEHVAKDTDLEDDLPTDTLDGQHGGQPIAHGGNEEKCDNSEYWTAQVAALRFENGQLFEQLTTLQQELGLARSQINNAEIALQAWMHHASCLEFRNNELQSHPLEDSKVSEASEGALGQLQRSSDSELLFTPTISLPLSLTRYLLHSGSDSELRQELMNHVGNGGNDLVDGSRNTEDLVLQSEPIQQLQKGLQDLRGEIQRNLFWQRNENEIALQEQRRSDEELAALTKRVVELEVPGHHSEIQVLRDEFRTEWHSSLQAIRDAFQGRLDRLEANDYLDHRFDKRLRSHLFDERLLELSRAIQDVRDKCGDNGARLEQHLRSHSLEVSKVSEATVGALGQLQSSSDSELPFKSAISQPLSLACDQLQGSSDSELKQELMNQVGHGGNELVVAEPPQRSVAELQAVFERLQTRPPATAHLTVSYAEDNAERTIPSVDMGVYVSNSIHIIHEPEDVSDTESQILAKQITDMGYDPEAEIQFGNSDRSDDDLYDQYRLELAENFDAEYDESSYRHTVPTDEPWT